jgi:multidrug efflux pump subunit AcrA (membrane-fusion protein)
MNRAIVFFSVIIAIVGCSKQKGKIPEPANKPPTAAVTQIIGIGKISPENGISEVASPVSGIVTDVTVAEGSSVT